MIPRKYKSIDDYLEDRLNEWAEWLRTGNQLGIGYPSQSILALIREGKIITQNKKFCISIETNESAEEIEKMVCQMAEYKRLMADVLRSYYLNNVSMRTNAKKLDLSLSQYNIYLQMGKQWLAGSLSQARNKEYSIDK